MPKPKSRWNFCPPWKQARGKGQSVAEDTGGQWGELLTRLSASGFGIANRLTWFSSFGSSFPGTGQPQDCPAPSAGTELSWINICVSRIIFPTISFKGDGKKSYFLPSFSVGQLPSFPGAVSPPAQAQPGLGTEGKIHLLPSAPRGWGWVGIFHFPEGRIFLKVQSQ